MQLRNAKTKDKKEGNITNTVQKLLNQGLEYTDPQYGLD